MKVCHKKTHEYIHKVDILIDSPTFRKILNTVG